MWNLITLCNSCHDGIHTAVQDGIHGLTILPNDKELTDANKEVQFKRANWWRPQ